jgi:uncharacterized protein
MARPLHVEFVVRLSTFNLYVSDFPEPGTTLVHNTFSGGFAELTAPTLAALRKADGGQPLDASERELIDPQLADPDVGIVVEDRQTEERAYRAWYETRRSRTDEMSAIVSVTFACNLDCTYCCQSDVLDGTTMKEQVADETARWLADRALEVGARRLRLTLVGGEPLLHPARIERLVEGIRGRVGDRVAVAMNIITNGVFLTRDLVERWLPLGLESAQVTLDGDETTHALTRRSKKRGEDSFATIFRNVIDVCDLIRVVINGNYTEETASGFVPLVKKLAAAGFPAGARINFSPALAALGAPTDAAYRACNWSGSQPELIIAFSDEIRRAGFDAGDPMVVGPCSFHDRHHYAVDPQGHIYKCAGFLGHPEWAIGRTSTGLGPRYHSFANMNPQRECGSCANRPDCGGGCLAAAWTAAGRVEGVNCEKPYFDAYQNDLIARRYLMSTTESPAAAVAAFANLPPLNVKIPDPAPASPRRVTALRVIAA